MYRTSGFMLNWRTIFRFVQKAPVQIPNPLPEYIERVKEIKKNDEAEEALFCSVCSLYLNSAQQLKSHMKSTKHKMVQLGLIDKKTEQLKKRDIVSKSSGKQWHINLRLHFKFRATSAAKLKDRSPVTGQNCQVS